MRITTSENIVGEDDDGFIVAADGYDGLACWKWLFLAGNSHPEMLNIKKVLRHSYLSKEQ